MSGHSKWATIHRQKESKDARRGQIFTKIGNAITIAVKAGGGITDPEKNFKLRLAIERARAINMPKENIERALRRGLRLSSAEGPQGKLAGEIEEITYEGYGPGGVAIIAEAVTDNKNRTTAEIKNLFERGGGSLTGPGAVLFQFEKAGLMTVKKNANPDAQVLKIMDLGVEDVEEATDAIEVYTNPQETTTIKEQLQKAGFEVLGTEQILKPKTTIKIKDAQIAEKVLRFMENLEEHDDIQRVFGNFDIPDELLE
ncbi:YebC/PmpR family DNA-binding transcriptional regulator [Candidatus Shapirobacteria bacterium CG_4_9_14_0_2_um_filter_39_11]|uniref:Probable transcriptional regulatory protein CO054_02495 n=1 Tax=Candidatus Shapirobacteria bacterium CG_4_9_14_0_2_um_filter_39_11 TaxID=1974478 RepID=A0A2M8ESB7_9BACT|nr:MAG: YebC/PmpR family DNA-binding transcriptional regulator [Candidatus Shapirobacteria bacterium CG_4_9_14_0_2_um_filter_39_11]